MPQDIKVHLELKVGPRLYLAGFLGILSKFLDRKAKNLVAQCVKVTPNGRQ